MVDIPAARPLVVDEAYFEYGGETAVPLIGDDVIVVRTFSKAFGLASARVGYALASAATAAELNERQQPAPISTISARRSRSRGSRPGRPTSRRRSPSASGSPRSSRGIGLEPLPSYTNFLLVPHPRAQELYEALLARGARGAARHRARFASRCTGPTPTTGSSRRSAERCDAGQHVARPVEPADDPDARAKRELRGCMLRVRRRRDRARERLAAGVRQDADAVERRPTTVPIATFC